MVEVRLVGRGAERDLFLAVVEDLVVPDVSKVPRPFVLLVAVDVGDLDAVDAARFADEFLAVGGCVYVCTWGEACSWLHDVFDAAFVRAVPEDRWDDEFVMTSWHDDEPLDEVLWFAVFAAYNDPGVESVLAVTSKAYAEQIERRFSNVDQLNETSSQNRAGRVAIRPALAYECRPHRQTHFAPMRFAPLFLSAIGVLAVPALWASLADTCSEAAWGVPVLVSTVFAGLAFLALGLRHGHPVLGALGAILGAGFWLVVALLLAFAIWLPFVPDRCTYDFGI